LCLGLAANAIVMMTAIASTDSASPAITFLDK